MPAMINYDSEMIRFNPSNNLTELKIQIEK